MANCSELFLHFNNIIRLNDQNRTLLISVRDGLRTRMATKYEQVRSQVVGHTLEFQSQGSFVMDTIIIPKDDDFDLDDGVYFIGALEKDKRPPTESFHKWVMQVNQDNKIDKTMHNFGLKI
jgi:hypothetical protein